MEENSNNLGSSSKLIVDVALLRGISVKMHVSQNGLFDLSYKGRVVKCSGSLTDYTSVIAEEICYNKELTNTILNRSSINVPVQTTSTGGKEDEAFLEQVGSIVIKPVSQSHGNGISVDITTVEEVEKLTQKLKINGNERILLEKYIPGEDVRVIVIDHVFTAAIHRYLPCVIGDDRSTVKELVDCYNSNRESSNCVPDNYETKRCIEQQSYTYDSVLPLNTSLILRKNANESTGAIAVDITNRISPAIRRVSERISRIIDIPVAGIDFILPNLVGDKYTVIEVNSRPGLDGHEPQPVVERFIDFLFPETC